ncbi:uncharacterized protein LOC114532951 [Dendronephthya gigantea]|uniref:uncharacterized protein LOC114532951 n=1 Tax=Dendronephthya gigantea TaxID=151771 RepID=UPI00106DB871|nr:uncharacterized protein LOC114532951 [Dendronephthya gigantea]
MYCLRRESCASANYKTSGIGKGRCELNAKTLQEKTDVNEQANPEFNHLVIVQKTELHPTSGSSLTQDRKTTTAPTCSIANWMEISYQTGWLRCGKENLFITGLLRNPPYRLDNDPIILLEEARCCNSTSAYSGQNGVCKQADWVRSLDVNNAWSNCPEGYFLNGLYRSAGNYLHRIEYGHCCKPNNHTDQYGSCYEEDVGTSFDQKGWSNCSQPGHYITGLYRGNGDWLNNIDKFRCCQMVAI